MCTVVRMCGVVWCGGGEITIGGITRTNITASTPLPPCSHEMGASFAGVYCFDLASEKMVTIIQHKVRLGFD